jgi:voltage-gated potassium channel
VFSSYGKAGASMNRLWLTNMLDPDGTTLPPRLFRFVHAVMLVLGVGVVAMSTDATMRAEHLLPLQTLFYFPLGFFTLEYVARLIVAPDHDSAGNHLGPWAARLRWTLSLQGLIDLVGVLPLLAVLGLAPDHLRLLGILWVLKLGRHSSRLGLLGRVLRHAREPMEGVFFAFIIILVLAATLAYLIESSVQPQFNSIPAALWWAVTTLTTTGYGDMVPATPLGRLLGGTVMVCGIAVFALWAGILATEFAQEMRRHDFLRTWDLVAKVPFFQKLGAESIAEVTRLLKPREVQPGTVLFRRGEAGDRMFFIVGGEVQIQMKPKPVHLGPGSFFGEIALITRGPRTATVSATRHTVLLELDIADFRELAAKRPELTRAIDEEATRRVEQARTAG